VGVKKWKLVKHTSSEICFVLQFRATKTKLKAYDLILGHGPTAGVTSFSLDKDAQTWIFSTLATKLLTISSKRSLSSFSQL